MQYNNIHLEDDRGNFFSNILWGKLWFFRLLRCWNASDEIHFHRMPDTRSLDDFVAKVQHEEQRDVDIGCEETGGVEIPEYGKTIDKDEEHRPTRTPVSKVWLPRIVVCVLFRIESLSY